jgi:beta-galactosidase
MLRRDRSHPSIVLWSIGNEIIEQSAVDGVNILKRLQDICHREDPTRLVCSACDNISAPEPGHTRHEFANALDVVGYNYTARWGLNAETLYDADRKEFPNRIMIGSENPSAGGIRGFYDLLGEGIWRMKYDTVTHNNEFLWRYTAGRDFVAGDYLWTGIDYLGESRWPMKGAPSSPVDLAGFPKDTYYYFRSIWNKDKITLHIAPHWNWKGKENEFVTVIGYTNCEEVSLYLNGRLVGTKGYDCPNVGSVGMWNNPAKKTHPTTHDLHLSWDVPYEMGELKAIGKIDGKVAAELIVKTTGDPVLLNAKADIDKIPLDGIAHIEIDAADKDGLLVPTAENLVKADASGAVQLLGLDNGDCRDLTQFSVPQRKLGAGRLLCVVRGTGKGEGKLVIASEGMPDITVQFKVE